jgi:hypothetical protein
MGIKNLKTTKDTMTNLQSYKTVQIESQLFAKGYTSVIYWGGASQTIAMVGAKTAAIALAKAKADVDACTLENIF